MGPEGPLTLDGIGMMKYSQQTTVDIFCNAYEPELSFKAICNEIESDDIDTVVVWEGMRCMSGHDISTMMHEVEYAISTALNMGK